MLNWIFDRLNFARLNRFLAAWAQSFSAHSALQGIKIGFNSNFNEKVMQNFNFPGISIFFWLVPAFNLFFFTVMLGHWTVKTLALLWNVVGVGTLKIIFLRFFTIVFKKIYVSSMYWFDSLASSFSTNWPFCAKKLSKVQCNCSSSRAFCIAILRQSIFYTYF